MKGEDRSSSSLPCRQDCPEVPARVRTRPGVVFDPRLDTWSIASETYRAGERPLRFSEFAASGLRFQACVKLGIIYLLENYSWPHADNVYGRFLHFHRCVSIDGGFADGLVDLHHLLRFRAELTPATLWKLGVVRLFLIHLHEAGIGIATDAAISHLRASRIPGNPTGSDIRTRDPERGAFSTVELENLQSALNRAYAEGRITLPDYALAILFLSFGCRPVQAAALKDRDLVVGSDGRGHKGYTLLMPRAKQRLKLMRQASPKARRCAQNVGRLLERLIEHNAKARREAGIRLDDPPLFPASTQGDLPDLHWHETASRIGKRLVNTLRVAIPHLKANPKRFRHTLAQRLADMGVSKYVIAELLDHSDTSNVGVYFEASPEAGARIDRRIAMDVAPLAQAFRGARVAPAGAIGPGAVPGGRIHDWALPEQGHEALGGCGQSGHCGLNVPRACYTCAHMRPFLEGPHQEELDALLADRERQRLAGYDERILEILDRTILAVAEVIQDCEAVRAELAGGGARPA